MKPAKITDIARASYDKNVLTLDLPRATQPMLWRQEIRNISNVVFLVATQDSGEHALVMKISNGTEQTIARFADAAGAEESLAAIRGIFVGQKPKTKFFWKLLKIIFWVVVVWLVVSFSGQLIAALMLKQDMDATSHTVTESPLPTTTPMPSAPAALAPAAPPAPTTNPAPSPPAESH